MGFYASSKSKDVNGPAANLGNVDGRPEVGLLHGLWYKNGIMTHVRMDKWLWAARFFKTRTLAARACEFGRIESNGQGAKAAREVRVGDVLHVKNDSGDFQVEVLVLSGMRGPAAVAQASWFGARAQ